ncbi:MAG: PcfJ domain-containing protein [Promethearchaeota archaeon]
MKSFQKENYTAHYLATPKDKRIIIYEHQDKLVFTSVNNKEVKLVLSFKQKNPQYYCYYRKTKILKKWSSNCFAKNLTRWIFWSLSSDRKSKVRLSIRRRNLQYCIMNLVIKKLKERDLYYFPKIKKREIDFMDFFQIVSYPILASCYYGNSQFPALFAMSNRIIRKWQSFDDIYYWFFRTHSKKLKKLFIQCLKNRHHTHIFVLWHLNNLVPIDYLYDINNELAIESFAQVYMTDLDIQWRKQFEKVFKNYPIQRIKKLFNANMYWLDVQDIIRQYNQYPDRINLLKKPKTLTELHDDISRQYRRIKEPYKELTSNMWHEIDGEMIRDLRISVAKDNHQLSEWGEKMNNCIASYASRADSKRALIALYRNNEIVYNLEIYEGSVRQFFGKCNQPPPACDSIFVRDYFKEKQEELFQKHLQKEKNDGNHPNNLSCDYCLN